MSALLFGSAALVVCGMGVERKRWPIVLLGSMCLVVGFFFKQTVAVFAAVPLLALFLRTRRPARKELLIASIPLGVMGAVIVCLGFVSPAIHHYMIAVPGAYSINWPRAAKFLWEFLLDSPVVPGRAGGLDHLRRPSCVERPAHALAAGRSGGSDPIQRDRSCQDRRLAQQPAACSSGDDGTLRAAGSRSYSSGSKVRHCRRQANELLVLSSACFS